MLVLSGWTLALGAAFLLIGAYPVTGFLGAEILLLFICFRQVIRTRKKRTHVRVTSRAVEIVRVDHVGRTRVETISGPMKEVGVIEVDRGVGVRICGPRQEASIGEDLTRTECAELARRLRRALTEAARVIEY